MNEYGKQVKKQMDSYANDPDSVDEEIFDIQNAQKGVEVRGSLASGVKKSFDKADWAGSVAEQILDESFDEGALNTAIEQKLNDLETEYAPQLTNIKNEVEDARGNESTLGNRLDGVSAQLAQTQEELATAKQTPLLKYGKLDLPNDFPNIPFNIFKVNHGEFTHNATPSTFFDWSDAVEVFISKDGASASGLNIESPINFTRFKSNFDSSVYEGNKFILTILDEHFDTSNSLHLDDYDINLMIRSGNERKFTWIGRVVKSGYQLSEWSTYEGIFKATQTNNYTLSDCVNTSKLTTDYPERYEKVSSLSECQNTKGTYHTNGLDVYANPLQGDNIDDLGFAPGSSTIRFRRNNNNAIVFENIGFLSDSLIVEFDKIGSVTAFFNCKFWRGTSDNLSVTGKYSVYLFDCEGAYASKDGFNYHTTDKNSLAVEVNCRAWGAGQYKLLDGQQSTNSNNGSTAHDGMYMLRVGCKYWDCEGPIVADVDDCYSISIGCSAVNQLDSSTGFSASFYFSTSDVSSESNYKYAIDCEGYGANFGIQANSSALTRYMGFKGNTVFNTDYILPVDFNKIRQ